MIEGLKIDVPSEELVDHLTMRGDYHREKRAFYERQAQQLIDGGIRENAGVSNDPTSTLQASAKQHGAKFAFFAFLADHVVADETYRLSEQDMTRLELVDRYI
jgi:hypothetical protein